MKLKKFFWQVMFLLKLIAIVLFGTGFFLGGIYLASQQTQKVQAVKDILFMLSVTQTNLRYACLPISDLLRILCETEKLSSLGFVNECKASVEKGDAFPKAWKEAVENDYELCKLLGENKKYLFRFGAELGSTDIESQLGCCEYYEQIFQKELSAYEENEKKYSKLYPVLGLMLGISAAIIII